MFEKQLLNLRISPPPPPPSIMHSLELFGAIVLWRSSRTPQRASGAPYLNPANTLWLPRNCSNLRHLRSCKSFQALVHSTENDFFWP